MRLMAELSGLPPEAALERAHEALFYVGLGEARYRRLETYSLGMKQLAKLAQAIVHGPKLIFLDEPTNGLDPPARLRMIKLIREIRDSGQANIVLVVALVARRRRVLRRDPDPSRRADRRLLQSRRRTKVESQVSDAGNARRSGQVCRGSGETRLRVCGVRRSSAEDSVAGRHRGARSVSPGRRSSRCRSGV